MFSPYSSSKGSHTSSGDGAGGLLITNFEENTRNEGPWTLCQNEVTRIIEQSRIATGTIESKTKRRLVEKEKLENYHYQQKLFILGERCRIRGEPEENLPLTREFGHINVDDCLEELQNNIYKIEAEKEQLQREISSLEKELQTCKYQTDSDKEHYLRENAELHREAGIYEQMVKELKRERDDTRQQVQKYEKQLEFAYSQLSQCAREKDTIYQSKFKLENDSRDDDCLEELQNDIYKIEAEKEQLQCYQEVQTSENSDPSHMDPELRNYYEFMEIRSLSSLEKELQTCKYQTDSDKEHYLRENAELHREARIYEQLVKELKRERDDARQQVQKCEKQLKLANSQLSQCARESDTIYQSKFKIENDSRVQTIETDIQSLISEGEQLKRLNKKLTEDISGYKQQINNLVQARDDALTRVQNLETDIQSFKSEGEQLKRLNRKITEENDRCKRQMHDLNKAKDDALTRLSKVAGAKLTHGNAAITDLSDDNRPTKIAEKFSELYDNAWTDAFEDIESLGVDEKECIHLLLSVLKRTFELCTQVEEKYEARILHAVQTISCVPQCQTLKEFTVQTNIQVVKSLCEIRLSMENVCSQAVEKMIVSILPDFLQTLSSKFDVMNLPSKLLDYTRNCARLCWLMRIRDPPLHLQFDIRRDDAFNQEYFRQYTKSGKKVDFMVWPVLFLHNNGPLLSKGVAQPK